MPPLPFEPLVRGTHGPNQPQHLSRPLDLYIYNHEYNLTRLLTIHPSRHWGGDGALGCTLGYGALHRLPAPLQEPPPAPGETFFDTSAHATAAASTFIPASAPADLLIPASQLVGNAALPLPGGIQNGDKLPPSTPGATAGEKRGRRGRTAGLSPNRAMDDYFREGEEKSRLEDRPVSSSAAKAASLPPPPTTTTTTSGPPKAAADASVALEVD